RGIKVAARFGARCQSAIGFGIDRSAANGIRAGFGSLGLVATSTSRLLAAAERAAAGGSAVAVFAGSQATIDCREDGHDRGCGGSNVDWGASRITGMHPAAFKRRSMK